MKENQILFDSFSNKLLKASLSIVDSLGDELWQRISAYLQIAKAYKKLGSNDDSSKIVNTCLNLIQSNRNNICLYICWEEIATYYLEFDHKHEAVDCLNRAFTVAREIDDYEERDDVLVRIGRKFTLAGEYDRVLNCAELVEDDLDRAELYKHLLGKYIDTKQYERVNTVIEKVRAIGWENLLLEEAVTSYLEQQDFSRAFQAIKIMTQEQSRVSALCDIAQNYWDTGNEQQAISTITKAKAIADRIQNSSKSWSLQAISKVARQTDTNQSSDSLLSASVESAKQIDDVFLQGFAFNNLAFQLASAGRYNEAIEIIESSNPFIPTFEKIRLLIQIADRYLKSSQPAKAEQTIDRAIKTVAEITGNELAIPKEDAQSFAWDDIANYALKHQQYELALAVLEQIETTDGKVHLLILISNTYIKDSEIEKAREALQQAIKILTEAKDNSRLSYSSAIADCYIQIKDYHSAIKAVKLISSDVYQAETLVAIALKYAESPEAIDRETVDLLEALI